MIPHIIKSEEDFSDYCPCAYRILNFVDSIKDTDVRWFFDTCYYHHFDNSYSVIFRSYVTDEFKDYVLSIEAKKIGDDEYTIRIVKKVDNLLGGNV